MKLKLLIAISILISTNAYADTLIIDKIRNTRNLNLPLKGLTMTQVANQFGNPIEKKAAIGTPPITVWKYDKFSVYFENKWVINSVVNRKKQRSLKY